MPWYKEAVFYELPIQSFYDSNGDGIGDLPGLTQKLDYLDRLGVDCLWLLPMYPSPLRDGGYDIADFYGIQPRYGTLEDFDRFIEAAHERKIRVIADLVLNHTSDQHAWFQDSRRPGSARRDWYVWSSDNQKYKEARVIFSDTEESNWTWDPFAGAYYWHRFFSHQPDLNYDNPEVRAEMLRVVRFWLDRGLDGFRIDAIPFLFEREGTSGESLPETHAYLKELRAAIDRDYADRVLLAEANQRPEDVRPYFGGGDECHMAFHFPLMPRLFLALRREDRQPIVDILRETPMIPDSCQWALFLRNHDDLTLEMVTAEERKYMLREYAPEPRMRLNQGIRRRLAPLVDFRRPEIELLTSLILSLAGSPVLYYGDEIEMADNVDLDDRDGLRTPLPWGDVLAQERRSGSLLQWMKGLIAERRRHPAFGQGSLEILEPANPHILAYRREHADHSLLVVNNLSHFAQPVAVDLARFRGCTPVEVFGQTRFPTIGDAPYPLTLAPHGFLWFRLER
jgi:maltose alpha-D-glucosyltransferase / alpha-amylase